MILIRPLLGCALLLLLSGCDRSLEVTGATQRVVGQTVSFELTEGEPTFEGQVWLRAADGVIYRQNEIKATKKNDRSLSFVIPTDVAVGDAEALVWAGGGVYKVPLEINRLALTIDEKGVLEGWPLPPGLLAKPTRTLSAGAALAAVTPGGGELVVANGGQLLILELGAELKDATAGIKLVGTTVIALAAVPDGALAATETSLSLIHFVKGGATTQKSSLSLPNHRVVAVAASEAGDRAFVLSACDTNSDSQPDSDCVTEVLIGSTLSEGRRAVLDATPSATTIGATRDGRGVVVGDSDVIHGAWFDAPPTTPRLTKVAWVADNPFAAQPVSIDRAASVVKSGTELKNVDLFAVAEKTKNMIALCAFNPGAQYDLQKTSDATAPEPPVAVSYGRRTELLVAAGKSLYTLEAGQSNPALKKLGAETGGSIQAFVVQP